MGAPTLERFLRKGRPADVDHLVVCAGDSTTQGVASANWVGMLQDELGSRGFQFVRAAWGGYLSHSLLLRIDSVIACRPDAVVVMIGTNDVMATTSDAWRESYARQNLPETPTLETYRAWLDEIVSRLLAETSARVALLEVPPIGEDLGSAFNERVASFNRVVRELAAKHGVEVLPLNARLAELIEESSTAQPFDGTTKEIRSALLQRFLLRRRWDRIAARAGRVALTDNIHLTDRAGREAAALVRAFVEDLAVERRAP